LSGDEPKFLFGETSTLSDHLFHLSIEVSRKVLKDHQENSLIRIEIIIVLDLWVELSSCGLKQVVNIKNIFVLDAESFSILGSILLSKDIKIQLLNKNWDLGDPVFENVQGSIDWILNLFGEVEGVEEVLSFKRSV